MNNRLEEYLETTTKPVAAVLGESERAEWHKEAEQHILDRAKAYEELGDEPEIALANALRDFGNAKKVGRQVAVSSGLPRERIFKTIMGMMLGGTGLIGCGWLALSIPVGTHNTSFDSQTILPNALLFYAFNGALLGALAANIGWFRRAFIGALLALPLTPLIFDLHEPMLHPFTTVDLSETVQLIPIFAGLLAGHIWAKRLPLWRSIRLGILLNWGIMALSYIATITLARMPIPPTMHHTFFIMNVSMVIQGALMGGTMSILSNTAQRFAEPVSQWFKNRFGTKTTLGTISA